MRVFSKHLPTHTYTNQCIFQMQVLTPTYIYTYWNDWTGSTCVLTAQPRQVGHFQVPKNCTSDAKTEKLRPLFLCKHTPKWWITYLFYAFNTSGWVLSQLFKNWLIWSLFLLLKWRTWLGCGVTGWTNFKVIFLFLLLTIHDLTSIGPVAGGSDNFLIFWAALLPHPIVNEGAQSNA